MHHFIHCGVFYDITIPNIVLFSHTIIKMAYLHKIKTKGSWSLGELRLSCAYEWFSTVFHNFINSFHKKSRSSKHKSWRRNREINYKFFECERSQSVTGIVVFPRFLYLMKDPIVNKNYQPPTILVLFPYTNTFRYGMSKYIRENTIAQCWKYCIYLQCHIATSPNFLLMVLKQI